MWNLDHSDGDFMTPFPCFQGHESYLLSLLSENNKCDSISEYIPNHGTQTYGSPTEWYNQDVGLDLGQSISLDLWTVTIQ